MAVTADPVRGNVRLKYEGLDETTWTYSVAKLDPAASAANLLLIAEAVADLQSDMPVEILNSCEYELVFS
jgi:hypothetical protein